MAGTLRNASPLFCACKLSNSPRSPSSMLPGINALYLCGRVDLGRRLVPAHAYDTRKAQREPAVVPAGAHDGIEGDFQHNLRLDLAQMSVISGSVRQEPFRQLGNFLIRQA